MRKPAGSSAGSTKRVTAAAATSPTIEYSPSCASPGRPEKSSAENPAIEVSTPRRTVGQKLATHSRSPRSDCTKK